MNFISSNIKFLRTLAGLSQTELADKVGLNRGNITSYERGIATPGIDALQRMATFFEVELVDLINKNLSIGFQTSKPNVAHNNPENQPEHLQPLLNPSILGTIRQLSAHQYTNQQEFMNNVANIANQLERIAESLEILAKQQNKEQ